MEQAFQPCINQLLPDRLQPLRKNPAVATKEEGHEFIRATKPLKCARALAPEACFLRPRRVFSQSLHSCRNCCRIIAAFSPAAVRLPPRKMSRCPHPPLGTNRNKRGTLQS